MGTSLSGEVAEDVASDGLLVLSPTGTSGPVGSPPYVPRSDTGATGQNKSIKTKRLTRFVTTIWSLNKRKL